MTSRPTADFAEFVTASSGRLLRTAFLLTGNRHDAEDLVQSAYARLFPRWVRISAMEQPYAYARRVLVTQHISQSRRRRLRELLVRVPPDVAEAPVDRDDELVIRAAVAALPSRQRAVFVLRYWEDLPEAEIAAVLGCSRGTVKSQAAKALASLRHNGTRESLLTAREL
jgi:RNA polymerase sigma-70 factor (sigma-E family)